MPGNITLASRSPRTTLFVSFLVARDVDSASKGVIAALLPSDY